MDALWCGNCAKDLVVTETSESVVSLHVFVIQ
jgi:hypothetical protein